MLRYYYLLLLLISSIGHSPAQEISTVSYDSGEGKLVITGSNFVSVEGSNDIDPSRLFVRAGSLSYNISSATVGVEITDNTSATIDLAPLDMARLNSILNKNGMVSESGSNFILEASEGWNGASSSVSSVGIAVSNYNLPAATSATYSAGNSILTIRGDYFASSPDQAISDISTSSISVRGGNGSASVLEIASIVKITNPKEIVVSLNGPDLTNAKTLLNRNGVTSFEGTKYSMSLSDDWNKPVSWGATEKSIDVTVSGVISPAISSADYDFVTGLLNISGQNLVEGAAVDVSKFIFTNGSKSYRLTATNSSASVVNANAASVNISGTDRGKLNSIFNRDGNSSLDGATYYISVESGWNGVGEADSNNEVAVSNHALPSITSATYNVTTGVLNVTGANFVSDLNAGNKDVAAQKLTVGRGVTVLYTFSSSTSDVSVISNNQFSFTLAGAEKAEVDKIYNWNGLKSYNDSVFYLFASDDWNLAADASFNLTDSKNAVEVSGVPNYPPQLTEVNLSGELITGKVQKVSYTYDDLERDEKDKVIVKWYSCSDADGANPALISETSGEEYTLTAQEVGRFYFAELTPVALSGSITGTMVRTGIRGPVANAVPVAESVSVSGDMYLKQKISGSYVYSDPEKDPEGTSIYTWYRADSENGPDEIITGADKREYEIQKADLKKYISFHVQPVAASGSETGVTVASSRIAVLDSIPVALGVTIEGSFKKGGVLTGVYNYHDLEEANEAVSAYNWYRSATTHVSGRVKIIGANTKNYVVQTADMNMYLSFEVIPVASDGNLIGNAASSPLMGPVENSAPVAKSVVIKGSQIVCKQLYGEYSYSDLEGDPEGATSFRWLRASSVDGEKEPIEGATDRTYTLTLQDQGKYIFFEVWPKSIQGNTLGEQTASLPAGAIVNMLPSLTMFGSTSICSGSTAKLTISFAGSAPWQLTYTDGTDEYSIVSSTPVYSLSVSQAGVYKGVKLVDNLNCPVTDLPSSAQISVLPLPEVSITGLKSAYNVKSNPVQLTGTPAGGVFTGPGVISSTGVFYPSFAGTQNSPHAIIYEYKSPTTGCVNRDTVMVEVIDADASISGVRTEGKYCNFDPGFTVTATNSLDAVGSFAISGGTGLVDNGNNTATVNPASLSAGNYTISYTYTDKIPLSIYKEFTVEVLGEARIFGLNDSRYCRNANAVEVSGNYTGGIFQGEAVYRNADNNKYYFTPSLAEPGVTTVTYSYTTSYGCVVSKAVEKTISPVPETEFSIVNNCYNGDSTIFKNKTDLTTAIAEWKWKFGDSQASEANNLSSIFEPKHKYLSSGDKTVVLIAQNIYGCKDTTEKVIHLGDIPDAGFSWDSQCYSKGMPVSFKNTTLNVDEIVKYKWEMEDTSKVDFVYASKDVLHTFPIEANFLVKLKVTSAYGCSDSIRKVIAMRPVVVLKDTFYSNNFEKGKAFWLPTDSVAVNNWFFGLPGGTKIASAYSGNKAYYTSLKGARNNQQLTVTSPCFDFTGTQRPYISMASFVDATAGKEGAVLQYSLDNELTWTNVGGYASGLNWFNDFAIQSQPGGQQIGWSGKGSEWVESLHNLDFLIDKSPVRFRVVFGQTASTSGTEGFAFDDIYIGTRTKSILFEHFTNNSQAESLAANEMLDNVVKENATDAVAVQYHTSFPGVDTFNLHNPSDPGSRVLYYGIGLTPFSLLEGGTDSHYTYDFTTKVPNSNDIKIQSLHQPGFSLTFNLYKTTDKISGSLDVKALKSITANPVSARILIVEDIVSQVAGKEVIYKNVVKKMLPSAGGTVLSGTWAKDKKETINFSWDYKNVYNPKNVHIVAFLQDESTKEIYQVATDDTSDVISGSNGIITDPGKSVSTTVYPNPAKEWVNIDFSETLNSDLSIQILSMNGKLVLTDKIMEGVSRYELNISEFENGIYFIRILSGREVLANKKLVVLH